MDQNKYFEVYQKVMDANVLDAVELDIPQLRYVRFDLSDGEFGWIAAYRNGYSIGYMNPMKTANYVKTWKTLNGAKRNFLKTIEKWFK